MENERYLTYEEYMGLGGTLDMMPFNLLELEARINIDRETQNRLKNVENIPMEVKLCMYNLIQGLEFDANYKDADSREKKEYIARVIYNGLCGVVVDGIAVLYRGI